MLRSGRAATTARSPERAREATMNLVDLDRVSMRYGEDEEGTLALHRTTLKVSAGEFVAVVGPSGCGKSTLMKVVTGLWPATAGTVRVSGKIGRASCRERGE